MTTNFSTDLSAHLSGDYSADNAPDHSPVQKQPSPIEFWLGVASIIISVIVLSMQVFFQPVRLSEVIATEFADHNTLLFLQPVTTLLQRLFVSGGFFDLLLAISVAGLLLLTQRRRLLFQLGVVGLSAAALVNAASLPAAEVVAVLCILSVVAVQRKAWVIAGMLAALAFFARPTALIFVIPVLIIAVRRERFTRFIAGLSAVSIAIIAILLSIYGNFWTGLLLVKVPVLELPDLVLLLPVMLLLIPLERGQTLQPRLAMTLLAGLMILALLLNIRTGDLPTYATDMYRDKLAAELDKVFARSTDGSNDDSANCRIAFTRLDDPILLQAVVRRVRSLACTDSVITALDGQLQPDIRRMIEQNNPGSALIAALPDVIIDTGGFSASIIETSGMNFTRQSTVENVTFWIRDPFAIGEPRVFSPDAAFGIDVHLDKVTLERLESVSPALRVRLEWTMARPATEPITVEVKIGDLIAVQTYSPAVFRQGEAITYLYLPQAADLAPGTPITVTARVNNGTLSSIVLTS